MNDKTTPCKERPAMSADIKTWQERVAYENRSTPERVGRIVRSYTAEKAMLAEIADLRAELARRDAVSEDQTAAWVNGDELDNMLTDRAATVVGTRDAWHATPLYRRPAVVSEGQAVAAGMSEKYGPDNPPRLRKSGESVRDYRISMGWDKPAAPAPEAPHILEALSWHARERDDLTLDEAINVIRCGWRTVSGRSERAMLLQIASLLAGAPSAPTAAQAPEVAAGVELVARHIEKMRDDYHRDLGRQESDTGAWNYPPGGQDWMNMMDELVEEIRALAAQPKAAPVAEAPTEWKCFHCGEAFTDKAQAALHFGKTERETPACQFNVAELREMEALLTRYADEDTDLYRQLGRMQSQHAVALRREEEKGYARGLKDANHVEPAPATEQAKKGGLLRAEKQQNSRYEAIQNNDLSLTEGRPLAPSKPDLTPEQIEAIYDVAFEAPTGSGKFMGEGIRKFAHALLAAQASPAKPDLVGLKQYTVDENGIWGLDGVKAPFPITKEGTPSFVLFTDVKALLAAITKETGNG